MSNLKNQSRATRSPSSSSEDIPLAHIMDHNIESRVTHAPSTSSDEVLYVSETKLKCVQNNAAAKEYDILRLKQLVTCEFCEEMFLNRYDHIVHNASHIIIPLLRNNILQCRVCSQQCQSHRKLGKHMKKRHPNISIINLNGKEYNSIQESEIGKWESETQSLTSNVVKQELDVTEESLVARRDSLVINLDSKRHCESIRSYAEIKSDLVNSEIIIEISDSDDDVIMENGDDITENGDSKENKVHKESSQMKEELPCIRDRLMFEEDMISPEKSDFKGSDLIQDLTSECKINMDLQPPWHGLKEEDEYRSIHYDELVSPQKVQCRLCRKEFPNRYKVVIHETMHIEVTKGRPLLCRYCDWYICEGNGYLSAHVRKKHAPSKQDPNNIQFKRRRLVKCKKCKLFYASQNRHMENYHSVPSCISKLAENGEIQIKNDKLVEQDGRQDDRQDGGQDNAQNGVQIKYNKKILKICDLCFSFLRYSHASQNFTIIGEHCEIGNRLCCDKCGRECFELKLVEVRTRSVIGAKHGPKVKSNYDRLKNIQNRLKMMKSL